jgi:hypothetical protein
VGPTMQGGGSEAGQVNFALHSFTANHIQAQKLHRLHHNNTSNQPPHSPLPFPHTPHIPFPLPFPSIETS